MFHHVPLMRDHNPKHTNHASVTTSCYVSFHCYAAVWYSLSLADRVV